MTTVADRVKRWRRRHPERQRQGEAKAKERRRELKAEVLAHYGHNILACVVCGEDRLACLSIDHIRGFGNLERRTKLSNKSSGAFYRWLKSSGFPEGYQTLCMNCQFVKRFENNEHTLKQMQKHQVLQELAQMGVSWES